MRSSSAAFDLRYIVRERMIGFLQKNYLQSLPTRRDAVTFSSKTSAKRFLPRSETLNVSFT